MEFFQPEGEDDLKKMQLMELAILNGTYRDAKLPITIAGVARKLLDEYYSCDDFLFNLLTHVPSFFSAMVRTI